MQYKELLEKYNVLLSVNNRLTEENNRLKERLGITTSDPPENCIIKKGAQKPISFDESTDSTLFPDINNTSGSISKIRLFMSFFKGRDDVYAKRWENKKKATSGMYGFSSKIEYPQHWPES